MKDTTLIIGCVLMFTAFRKGDFTTGSRSFDLKERGIGPPIFRGYFTGPVVLEVKEHSLDMDIKNKDGKNILFSTFRSSSPAPPTVLTNTLSELVVKQPNFAEVRLSSYKYLGSECVDVSWKATECVSEILKNCFDFGSAHWYGGPELMTQHWPLEKVNVDMKPYMTFDMVGNDRYGPVQERLFFNSAGVGIYVEEDIPLFVSMNSSGDNSLCFEAKYDNLYYASEEGSMPELNYTVCTASDVKSIHQLMSSKYIKKPSGIPNENMFKYPIWSTWAEYKTKVNQSLVTNFVSNIKKHNFSIAQIEIDDVWTVKYGDLEFDKTTFPDPKQLVASMHGQNVSVTLWVHPFINIDAKAFPMLVSKGWMMKDPSGQTSALTSWWNGKAAGHIDFSNPDAAEWFLSELRYLKRTYGIDAFKFDAGDQNYIPLLSKGNVKYLNRNHYTRSYAQTAHKSDAQNRMEIRVGVRNQDLPAMVRIMDRYSTWDNKLGLRSVITAGLLFSILGYPFVLPDLIGGNRYNTQPDSELLIRWVQANAFMPFMQLSIPPWESKNSTVVEVYQEMVKLHERYADVIIDLANQSVSTGYPIMRPLWWIAPTDESALTVDDQFLVGDDLLVAPVVNPGETIRKLYLPAGRWRDELKGQVLDGGKWIDYPVTLKDLPYFTKQK